MALSVRGGGGGAHSHYLYDYDESQSGIILHIYAKGKRSASFKFMQSGHTAAIKARHQINPDQINFALPSRIIIQNVALLQSDLFLLLIISILNIALPISKRSCRKISVRHDLPSNMSETYLFSKHDLFPNLYVMFSVFATSAAL